MHEITLTTGISSCHHLGSIGAAKNAQCSATTPALFRSSDRAKLITIWASVVKVISCTFHNKLKLLLFSQLSFFLAFCQAETTKEVQCAHYPFYLGAGGGYGSTTWDGLVPIKNKQNLAINISTPIRVREGGALWGFFVGYEFIPSFALEASYMRYPNATVIFDPISLFTYMNDGRTQFVTHTESVSLMGKILLAIPNTRMRIYSSAGAASVHRNDLLANRWRLNPTFGLGLNCHFTEHLAGELAGNYIAGFGESQLNPTETYFPFLYSISLRLAYYF
jgi:Outer membrane protein beta-barrel domain